MINSNNQKNIVSTGVECQKESRLFDNQLLGYKQAASYLGVSVSYLRQLKRTGKIAAVLIGTRAIRFRVASLNSFVKSREVLK